ncbi:hypothetical protein GTX14_04685 [Streptomyces sp. SID4944]|nr:hypothetical protein [Streptomyces sp. SID4944]
MTDTPMTPDREQEIRTLDLLELMSDRAAPVISGHLAALLGEVDRLRARVAELDDANAQLNQQIAAQRSTAKQLLGRVSELTAAPVDEAVEMAEAEVELEAMRREHPAPCRVPDSPDCTCPSTERLLARDELKKALRGHLFGGGTP